jgi:hypothetical protein
MLLNAKGRASIQGGIIVAGLLSGCNQQPEQTSLTQDVAPQANIETNAGTGTQTKGTTLGTEQAAGPFRVVLTTPTMPPKVGETPFTAQVTRGGTPITGATVNLKLSMPSMNMGGPESTLALTGDRYMGNANLGMAGEWQADVAVKSGNETGTAVYVFNVPE